MSAILSVLNPSGARLDWGGTVGLVLALGLLLAGYEPGLVELIVTVAVMLFATAGRGTAITVEQKARAKEIMGSANSVRAGAVLFGIRTDPAHVEPPEAA
jgi:hypothetical protein